MKIKNIGGKGTYTFLIQKYQSKPFSIAPDEVYEGVPVQYASAFKNYKGKLMLGWTTEEEKKQLKILPSFYYTVGEITSSVSTTSTKSTSSKKSTSTKKTSTTETKTTEATETKTDTTSTETKETSSEEKSE